MHRDALFEELRRVEGDVVEGERQLAEQEALFIVQKRKGDDTSRSRAALRSLREAQQQRQAERHRLLALLRP
jgi:hypothetical protein